MMDMRKLMDSLARERPVFHSEADFQFALAWQIREATGLDVRLEYPRVPNERVYLDIWLPEAKAAIELKYFKKKLDVEVGGGAIRAYQSRRSGHQPVPLRERRRAGRSRGRRVRDRVDE